MNKIELLSNGNFPDIFHNAAHYYRRYERWSKLVRFCIRARPFCRAGCIIEFEGGVGVSGLELSEGRFMCGLLLFLVVFKYPTYKLRDSRYLQEDVFRSSKQVWPAQLRLLPS